jgi:putative endonuclease
MSLPTGRQREGQAGEDAALAYLSARGLTLAERNFRCKSGEIDLIMRDGESLVFVEVRCRAGTAFGGAAASVGVAKQARLVAAAQQFLQRFRHPPPCRFDVVAIDGGRLEWIRNALDG